MMGAGKSTIGSLLAKVLNFKFIDMDSLIEEKEKMTIKEIFASKGEAYFRNIEKKITLNNIQDSKKVIALGGGAFINPIIRNEVLLKTSSFWIDIKPDTLIKRTNKSNKRPLIDNKNLKRDIYRIYEERKDFYGLADYKINCNRLNKIQIVNKIVEIYENL
tara:strand:+ start:4836 stop:5318 length:483 start_codon:yes stop_codon:yes gene_type:complete